MTESVQSETVAFLANPATYRTAVDRVERIETHGAFVFLAGDDVYKIKRAVYFPYMDFSTLDRRRRACMRELEINRPNAPGIYLGVVAITRSADGRLAFDGDGEVADYAVHMRRFPADALLSVVAARSGIDAGLAHELADSVFAYHASARVAGGDLAATRGRGVDLLASVIGEVATALSEPACGSDGAIVETFAKKCRAALAGVAPLLERRMAAGKVRRCHGDLHLANIVMWQGKPTPFDAIEFDEDLATIDVLYDLSFLLMDLERHGQHDAASRVLSRYVWRSQDMIDIEGLAALPLFLALRAGIRAMVGAQRAAQQMGADGDAGRRASAAYLHTALAYLSPASPRLVAVGGVSGTGKSTLAAALAARLPPSPGALHLRSDLERKTMFGRGETDRLPAACYTAQASARVYRLLLDKARTALRAGHSVILDAAHLKSEEKAHAAALARDCRVAFDGLWLAAAPDILRARVGARTGDASDATVDVLERQLSLAPEAGGWSTIDAGGAPGALLSEASSRLWPPIASQ